MDKQLEQLVTKAQQHAPQREGKLSRLTQLVDEILRSRRICRSPRGQSLCGLQREIYNRVRQQLLRDVDRELHQLNPKCTRAKDWFHRKRNQAFRKVLDDVQLNKLALKAQRQPPQTELRRHALGELIEALRLSGKLCRPHREKFRPAFYDLLYKEALMETWIYICQNIDKYEPQRGAFRTWVNFRLDKLVIDCRRKFSNLNRKELTFIK